MELSFLVNGLIYSFDGDLLSNGTKVSNKAKISGRARIGHNCVIGPNVTVNDWAVIEDDVIISQLGPGELVIGEHAKIRNGAIIQGNVGDKTVIGYNTILMPGVRVGSYCEIARNVLIGPRTIIGVHTLIGDSTLIERGCVIADRVDIGARVRIFRRARIGHSAVINTDASIGFDATIGANVTIGEYDHISPGVMLNEGDWWITVGPQGSRQAMLTAVLRYNDLKWFVGCQYGISTQSLRNRVIDTYEERSIHFKDFKHFTDYMFVIKMIEDHPEVHKRRLAFEQANALAT